MTEMFDNLLRGRSARPPSWRELEERMFLLEDDCVKDIVGAATRRFDDTVNQELKEELYYLIIQNAMVWWLRGNRTDPKSHWCGFLSRQAWRIAIRQNGAGWPEREQVALPKDFEFDQLAQILFPNPATEAAREEQARNLHSALAQLEKPELDAVVFRFFDDMTIALISDKMGISSSSVRKLLATALIKLRNILKRYES